MLADQSDKITGVWYPSAFLSLFSTTLYAWANNETVPMQKSKATVIPILFIFISGFPFFISNQRADYG